MELRLQFLESFRVQGSDGASYKVFAYERLARDESLPAGEDQWASTGVTEYRLEDSRLVDERKDGTLRISGSDTVLTRVGASAPA